MARKQSSTTDNAPDQLIGPSSSPSEKPKRQQRRRKKQPVLVVPEAVDGIQVNFCKNPSCSNFGVPAEGKRKPGGRKATAATQSPRYKTSGGETPFIQCQSCSECPPIKSNLGIKEELDRISAYLEQKPEGLHCSNTECDNYKNKTPVSSPNYNKCGKTNIGTPRWKCKLCGNVFSVGRRSTHGQKKSHINTSIFLDLMNKAPFKAIARKNNVSMPTVYNKIDFIYNQCVAFVAHRERELPNYHRKRMEISVDRQEHVINWFQTENKRNIRLHAIASVDNRSGYVFGAHLNYDPLLNLRDIEAELHETQDYQYPAPFRRHARLWLRSDYHDSIKNSSSNGNRPAGVKGGRQNVDEMIEDVYRKAAERQDVEAYDALDTTCRLPEWGMQVHGEYTLYAHFFFLRRLLAGVEYIRFYIDQDSGLRAACLGAFADRVRDKTCDAFYVMVGKELTQGEKLSRVNKWAWLRDEFAATHTGYEDAQERFVRRAIVEERIKDLRPRGRWRDLWLNHPYATMSEPEKRVCYLTNLQDTGFDYKIPEITLMYDRASLHYVDCFFMQGRRLVSMLERPISASSTVGRKWYGFSAYRPEVLVKLMEIFRVYHNYVLMTEGTRRKRLKPGQKKRARGTVVKKSPAMRLGLARGKVDVEDILYFVPK